MERYGYSYRRMFIEQPRVRLDGVYIAICHYVFVSLLIFIIAVLIRCSRAGLSENHWVNVSFYVRALTRFFKWRYRYPI